MPEFSRLLIEEPPLQVLPSLTRILDINKAVILQQVQYWISSSKHEHEGHRWIYNSYTEWRDQFPWLKARTIQYHILGLEKLGLLVSGDFNKDRRDNTKWYRIDYDALDSALASLSDGGHAIDSQPPSEVSTVQDAADSQPLPETTQETTTEKTTDDNVRPSEFEVYEQNIGLLTPIVADKLKDALDHYPEGWVSDAIKVAAENNARSWRYIEKVLDNWESRGKDMALPRRNGRRGPESPTKIADPDKYVKGKYGHMVNR